MFLFLLLLLFLFCNVLCSSFHPCCHFMVVIVNFHTIPFFIFSCFCVAMRCVCCFIIVIVSFLSLLLSFFCCHLCLFLCSDVSVSSNSSVAVLRWVVFVVSFLPSFHCCHSCSHLSCSQLYHEFILLLLSSLSLPCVVKFLFL